MDSEKRTWGSFGDGRCEEGTVATNANCVAWGT